MEAISLKGTKSDGVVSATTLGNATLVWCANSHVSDAVVLTLDGTPTNGSGNSGSLSIPPQFALLVRKAPLDTISTTSAGSASLTAVAYNAAPGISRDS
jgi:hypothetical protein